MDKWIKSLFTFTWEQFFPAVKNDERYKTKDSLLNELDVLWVECLFSESGGDRLGSKKRWDSSEV